MFLSNVGKSKERLGNKKKVDRGTQDFEEAALLDALAAQKLAEAPPPPPEEEEDILPVVKVPLKYLPRGLPIPRDHVLSFFLGCKRRLEQKSSLRDAVRISRESKKPIQEVAIKLQRQCMEEEYGIEPEYGCQYIARVPMAYPKDTELLEAGKGFIFSTMAFFLQSIALRAKLSPQKLKTRGPMTPDTMHEFFEACNALMVQPQIKAELKKIYTDTGEEPNARVIELQRNMLETLGFEADHGCACLNKAGEDYPENQGLMMKFNTFAMGAQAAIIEAKMTDAEKLELYEAMPIFMHATPHMYFMRQNHEMLMRQREQQQSVSEAEVEAKNQLSSILGDPEKRQKFMEYKMKMDSMRVTLVGELAEWSTQQKKEFVAEFSTSDVFKGMDGDLQSRLTKMIGLDETQLRTVLIFQMLAAEDARNGGGFGIAKAHVQGPEADSPGMVDKLTSFLSTIGSGSGGDPRGHQMPQPSHGRDHFHGHSHSHGQSCRQSRSSRPAPDVASGHADVMER